MRSGTELRHQADRILVVCDDPGQQQLMRQVLEPAGYDVITANAGQSAADLLRAIKPRLVVLDLCLPGRSAQDLCRQIREVSEDVPILVLSDLRDVAHVILLFSLGADDYMTKPFNSSELLARIKASMRYSDSF
jgi:DNA-binding response OmpR family regulator